MANFVVTILLILSITNVVATISLWENWLDGMQASWAFNVLFAADAKSDIYGEVLATIVGSFFPAALAYVASARRWTRASLVHLLCGGWLLIYLFLRIPPLHTMFSGPFFDMTFGPGIWFRFHGFPAGTLVFTFLLLVGAATGTNKREQNGA